MSRAKSARPVVIAITSDQHCGSTTSLCPPSVSLDDGGSYTASKAQLWLWQCWAEFWARVDDVRTEHSAALYQIFNGDLVEGFHHSSVQVLNGNPNAQAAVVNAVMRIPLDLKPDHLAFIRGTESHVGQSASAEERIADGLRRDKRPIISDADTGTASHWHLKMDIQCVRIDLAHHGRVGTRPWTKPNVTANLAAEIFYDHAAAGEPHPHVAIRSHMHQLVDTHDQHPTRVIQTPAWQLATAFIHRIAPGKLADVGGIILVIRNGELAVEKVIYHPARARVWSPS
jgi:hypothetical protein